MSNTVVSIRLPEQTLDYLKAVAAWKSRAHGRKISYLDLVRESVESAYPDAEKFTLMDDFEKIAWARVMYGLETMRLTRQNAYVIEVGASRYPADTPPGDPALPYKQFATEQGLHACSVKRRHPSHNGSVATEHCVLLSYDPTPSAELIRSYVPEYVEP